MTTILLLLKLTVQQKHQELIMTNTDEDPVSSSQNPVSSSQVRLRVQRQLPQKRNLHIWVSHMQDHSSMKESCFLRFFIC